ncbi:hypothetical protein [Pseudonocardia sp. GCM10023141]|uniref:hypothetical protein n=1 Tax=Pseudonocardia sp. GCM10023141 TaxID=3252653 RepID=UPI003623B5FB
MSSAAAAWRFRPWALIAAAGLLLAAVAMFCCVDDPSTGSHDRADGHSVARIGDVELLTVDVVDSGPDVPADDCVSQPTADTTATAGIDAPLTDAPSSVRVPAPMTSTSSYSYAGDAPLEPVPHLLCVMRT